MAKDIAGLPFALGGLAWLKHWATALCAVGVGLALVWLANAIGNTYGVSGASAVAASAGFAGLRFGDCLFTPA